MDIITYTFDNNGKEILSVEPKGKDWPVVYLINNDKELYIGETQNAETRFDQHLKNPARKNLKKINIIFDDEFNKSAILDIEQSLIQLCSVDGKYQLQNMNGGQSNKHNYYQREKYLNKIDIIWKELKKIDLVSKDIEEVRNSDLFKYSPYNTLTMEQATSCSLIIYDMIDKLSKGIDGTSIICGGAGTGKTIVLINLMYKLVNATKIDIDTSKEDDELNDYMTLIQSINKFIKEYNNGLPLKVAYVCPMTSLRKTMKKVFKSTNGLNSNLVMGPFDVLKDETYDVLLVDESHRLAKRKNISYMGEFDKNAKKLGLDPLTSSQLDMLVKKSKYRILVYDKNQSVKGSDITDEEFNKSLQHSEVSKIFLQTQMRCKGGETYTKYINDIFDCKQKDRLEMDNYDFKLFDDVDNMVNSIKTLDKKYGLCRNAAGYAWPWKTKNMKKEGHDYKYIMDNHLEDINIQGHGYVWNMTNEEFIISNNAVNEIGCIHTLQGYDLNYVGVIIGNEIDYDPIMNKIVINRNNFYDKNVKNSVDDETLRRYIINSYKVIMTRGIKGCYVYVCNSNLKKYLERFIGK